MSLVIVRDSVFWFYDWPIDNVNRIDLRITTTTIDEYRLFFLLEDPPKGMKHRKLHR